MVTTKPRIQVTVTDELRQALDLAREEWPTLPESQLVVALAARGAKSLPERGNNAEARADALDAAATALADCYPTGYLDEIRAGWPA